MSFPCVRFSVVYQTNAYTYEWFITFLDFLHQFKTSLVIAFVGNFFVT